MSTIKDVCKLANVSKSTVSRVLNGQSRVSESTKARVLAAIEQLAYKPNLAAQSLASNRSNSIGLLIGTLSGSYYSALMSKAEQTARSQNFLMIATSGQGELKHEKDAIAFLKSKQVGGLIIHTGEMSDQDILTIVKDIPATIILNHYIPEIADQCIGIDDELGGYLATKHLLDNGHTRIACITGPMHQNVSQQRLNGYRSALSQAGIDYDENLVVEGRFDLIDNAAAPTRLLKRDLGISAIFCFNDHIALGVYEVLAQHGLKVGEDISVVGYDNSIFAPHITPKLSTVNVQIGEMGVIATNKVLAMIKDRKYDMPSKLEPELVVRDSVRTI